MNAIPKARCSNMSCARRGTLPRYEVLGEHGESNDRGYLVGVYAGDRLLGRGEGSSIKAAGREAARAALAGELPDDAGPTHRMSMASPKL